MRSFEEIEGLLKDFYTRFDTLTKEEQEKTGLPLPVTVQELSYYQEEKTRRMIEAALLEGKIDDLINLIDMTDNKDHAQQHLLLKFADFISDPSKLFKLIIDVYVNDGYDFPKKLIRKAKEIAPLIPSEQRLAGLPEGDPVKVWRGTLVSNPECTGKLKAAISWSTDKEVAIWFANRISNPYTNNEKGSVWEATIPREKIIAFEAGRNESEVIQYMNVQKPHLIQIPPEEWEEAIKHREDG